jgi:hypothetical protein
VPVPGAGAAPGKQRQGEQKNGAAPVLPVPGDAGTPAAGREATEHAPSLMPSFLSRVWRFKADADSYDASSNTLNVTVDKILNLPKRFKAQDDAIVDQDADVIFTKTTKVFDADGRRLRVESGYDAALDAAGSVVATAKIIPPAKWHKDEDGSPITTLRAKRVRIGD